MWSELRGILVVALVAGIIALAWTLIEARPVDDLATQSPTTAPPTATVTTTTTLDQDGANLVICELARGFADEASLVGPAFGPGPVARLALPFWSEVERLATGGALAEVTAVVDYYEDYLATTEPFDFDTARIIVEGDKEKLQQLLTRPAPGLEGSRELISLCGVTVPDQPSMDLDDFEDLEKELRDDDRNRGDR